MSELPQGWAFASLNELQAQGGIFADGDWIESKDQDPNGRNRLLQLADIGDRRFIDKSSRYVNDETFDRLNCTALEEGDILLARMPDPLGRACLMPRLPQRCLTVVDVAVFRSGSRDISHRWLMHTLNASPIREEISRNASGTTRKRIARGKLAELKVPVPPAAEQKRIAQKLDALLAQVDTLKARIDAIPALLKRFRQSVLESAFSGELTAEWRQLHPDTKAASITDVRQAWRDHYQRSGRKFAPPNLDPTNLRDDLPPTWQATQIGIIFDVFVGATPARDRTDFWKGSISWVSSAEVAFCRIRSTKEKITEAGYSATSTNLHPPGTVMLAMIGQGKTRGQPAILAIDACHNQNTAALRVHDEYCVPEYLYYYLWGKYEETRRFGGGNNQQALNKKSVQSLPFPLAPLAEQTEIVRRVEQLFACADQLEAKVAAAQQRIDALTQSLLAKAFRGELVQQDPSDEPASVLLERIRAQRAATPKPKRGRKAATS
nr:restriction endonuclease subunit S [Xanthomonas vasicola]